MANGNRLINEKSPYLLQHAYNPVNWYPWENEAFNRAKLDHKPIFLSIGYSTCHWCHVMERESFEDKEIASLLNASFISIKVDREERPDIDHLYMTFCQAMTGQGGWPLTIFMTPEKKPFFAGTYFPKAQQYGRPGFIEILTSILRAWTRDRAALLARATELTNAAIAHLTEKNHGNEARDSNLSAKAYHALAAAFDPVYGGFGQAPKFPIPHQLLFLLRYFNRTGQTEALRMADTTLTAMRQGGIYDHIGGGFCRYATDDKWLIPHFEKMLYDNALLLTAYLEGYQCTNKPSYASVAKEIIAYWKRELLAPEGGFYSAEDADSEGIEGKFYTFTTAEILEELGGTNGKIFCAYYHATAAGNFTPQKNILHTTGHSVSDFAMKNRLCAKEVETILQHGRKKLFALQQRRIRPHKDDKILTSWNALAVVGLAKAGRALQIPEYTDMAACAAACIEKNLTRNGRLYVRYRAGETAVPGYLDDYAYYLWALIELYESTYTLSYLKRAVDLAQQMRTLFFDTENGGFFFSGVDVEPLLIRHKEIYDGALPSGNSVAAWTLLRLAALTENQAAAAMAEKCCRYLTAKACAQPTQHTFFLMAELYRSKPIDHLIIAGIKNAAATQKLLNESAKPFLPHLETWLNDSDDTAQIRRALPHIANHEVIGGQPSAYLCRDLRCLPPVTTPAELAQLLS